MGRPPHQARLLAPMGQGGVEDAPEGRWGWAYWPRVPRGPYSHWLFAPLVPLPTAA